MDGIILVPDVHGRSFWKEAIPYVESGDSCIFLGDYTDPYAVDNISDVEVLNNFREILSFAHTHRDSVTLLLGNHDLSYLGNPWGMWTVYADRFCYDYSDVLAEYYNENADLFSLCAFREIGGKPFLFSHAGLHPVWVSWCGQFDNVDKNNAQSLAARIDELYHESLSSGERTEFIEALAMVGPYRGGNSFAGSMVWADCREYNDIDFGFTQIFGHTSVKGIAGRKGNVLSPYKIGNNIDIDCCCCFLLDQQRQLHKLKDVKTV